MLTSPALLSMVSSRSASTARISNPLHRRRLAARQYRPPLPQLQSRSIFVRCRGLPRRAASAGGGGGRGGAQRRQPLHGPRVEAQGAARCGYGLPRA